MVDGEAIILGRSGLVGHLDQQKSSGGTRPEWMGDEGSRQFEEGRGGVVTSQEAKEIKCSESLTWCITDQPRRWAQVQGDSGKDTDRAEMGWEVS